MARTDYNGLKQYLGLILLCVLLYIPGLTTLPPVDRDEARFAQATRQMLESRDFIRIRFQEKPRHKKPIGIHWLQAITVAATGSPNQIWPYRIPSVLGALVAVMLTFVFGKNLFDRQTGLFGAIITASSLLLVVEAHQATTDAALLATVVAAQGSLGTLYVRKRHGETVGLGIPITFWAAQGIGILLKGPILPLVSLLTILTLLVVDKRASYLRGLRVKLGIPLVALIVCPWAIAVTMATGGTFFGDALRSDLLPKLITGHESHGFPPGYYLLVVALTFWPGSLFLWPALRQAIKQRSQIGERFCLAWIIPLWLTFELIPTKLPHYILPLFPPLSLVTARLILKTSTASWDLSRWSLARVGFVLWLLVSVALAGAIVALPIYLNGRFEMVTLWPAGAAVLLLTLPTWKVFHGRLVEAAIGAILLETLILAPTLHVIMPGANGLWLSRSVARAVEQYRGSARDPAPIIAAAGYHEPSLVFLCGTGTKLVGVGEAALHLRQNPKGLALIREKLDVAFHKALTGPSGSVELLEKIQGVNYTKGKRMTLNLYGNVP
ncbi:MAG: glycosyltransferase family 39 protein [Deltaproteobacteria bacterium]|nr:glycosyltransferase family 39 protein [Deltaproteobacteria bacterium]